MLKRPELICIGAQKAGTSWLHEALGSRPDVWIPPFKELHFFDHKFIPANRKWTLGHIRRGVASAKSRYLVEARTPDQKYLEYLDNILEPPLFNRRWYSSIFDQAARNQICLDVTPEYSCVPLEGIAFIRKILPETKFIYIVRNPLERALSQLRMNVSRSRRFDGSDIMWRTFMEDSVILERGRYSEYIPRWQLAFEESQLLILPYRQISSDPESLMRRIEEFSGLPRHNYRNLGRIVHQSTSMILPSFVRDYLRKHTAYEEQYIRDAFGETFFSMT